MRHTLIAAVLPAVLLATPGPVRAADPSPAVYRRTVASTLNPTITPSKCTSVRITVEYTDPDRQLTTAGSRLVVTPAIALTVTTTSPTWRNGTSAAHHTLRMCGLDTTFPETPTGPYRVTALTGTQPSARFGFTLRYQAKIQFNATPEPVRRGAFVTLRASADDGWEYSDTHPVRFYFRAANATTWRYFGAATPRCESEPCDEGEVFYTATRRFRQSVPGSWKAVSTRTSYLESGSATDAITVR